MDKLRMESPDLTAQNIDRIAALFPNCITEMLDEEHSTPEKKVYKRAVNFELLKQMLSPDVVDGDEAYEFTWVGKKAAIVEANKPIRKTLRPCVAESKDWDTTENLYIEGDNLEVLKLLQESYLGKVKMIYIDPPYNTGNDFIYADDFMRSQEEENAQMGMYDEDENRLFKNTDTNGRFHSDWCSMIYSRLMLARNLLTDDGVIFISIGQDEIENITKMCNEIWGESNHISTLSRVMKSGGAKGIKVLSLFFIDEVAKYKQYDEAGHPFNGIYADMFEEEYNDILSSMQREIGDEDYIRYLDAISAHDTHAGYFSVDKKGKMTDSKLSDKKEGTSDDIDAYDLIMKNKELLLDRDPKKSPVRFIFSHSALREGWDNPNVFQICTLKQSSSEVRKRQEVGRGLRLCVNQDGERMDANVLGNDVQSINVLTVIASESYDSFAKGLQTELADAVAGRPVAVTADLFKGKVIVDARGNEQVVDGDIAQAIFEDLIANGYVKRGVLTDKYYADKANGAIQVAEEVADSRDSVINILDSVYDSRAVQPENARDKNVELQVDPDKLAMPEFKALWKRISPKSVYVVDFDTDELVKKAIASLNQNLHVPKIFFKVETGAMDEIKSRDSLLDGSAFSKSKSSTYDSSKQIRVGSSVKYDLIGKLVGETGLTRKAVVAILTGIEKSVFEQFKFNPEEFIIKAAALINDEKATAIIQHITYNVLDEHYDTDIFTEPTIKGKLGTNAMKAQRHLYDHIVYDSTNERDFAADLDTNTDVAVYVKLPDSFYIATPVGHYNPDWAIAFYEGTVKHIYFVAETKGSMSSMQLRLIEESKIHCAREHFKAISNGNVVYDVVDSYQTLLEKVMK